MTGGWLLAEALWKQLCQAASFPKTGQLNSPHGFYSQQERAGLHTQTLFEPLIASFF
jgi:hypothetical protein